MPRVRARARNVSTHCSKLGAAHASIGVKHANAPALAARLSTFRRETPRAIVSVMARLWNHSKWHVQICRVFRADLRQPTAPQKAVSRLEGATLRWYDDKVRAGESAALSPP